MEDFKSKKEVLSDYFFDAKEIWNEVCTLRDMSSKLLEWIGDMHSDPEKYNGGWQIEPNFMAGHTYIILNKISALAEKITNEDIDIFTE
jgi:hypothetical protein